LLGIQETVRLANSLDATLRLTLPTLAATTANRAQASWLLLPMAGMAIPPQSRSSFLRTAKPLHGMHE